MSFQPKLKNIKLFLKKNQFWKYEKARLDKNAHDKNAAWR